ncbi:MAG: transporter, family, 3-phenylpropionic acid transporter [Chloroflexota bacterium]|nr:transporter, family, 3-phenylpropionic acid transporter [Chloroflexota bacterium]
MLNKIKGRYFSLVNAYFLYWFAAAAFVPYMSVYYESRGLAGKQIGLLISIPYMVTAASSFLFGYLADLIKKPAGILRLCALGFITALVVLARANTFLFTVLGCLTYAISAAPMNPILDRITLGFLSDPSQYGRVRIGGSLGWGLGVLIVSYLLSDWNFSTMFIVSQSLLVFFLLNSFLVPTQSGDVPHSQIRLKSMADFLRRKGTLILLLANVVWSLAESSITGYLFLHIKMLGGSSLMMGLSMACAILSEMLGFILAEKALKHMKLPVIIALAYLLQFLRLCSLALVRDPLLLVPFQFCGGASFALIWSASVAYINRYGDPDMQTAGQALKSGVMSIGSSFSVLLGGYIYESYGTAVLFRCVALLILAVLLLGTGLIFRARRSPGLETGTR